MGIMERIAALPHADRYETTLKAWAARDAILDGMPGDTSTKSRSLLEYACMMASLDGGGNDAAMNDALAENIVGMSERQDVMAMLAQDEESIIDHRKCELQLRKMAQVFGRLVEDGFGTASAARPGLR